MSDVRSGCEGGAEALGVLRGVDEPQNTSVRPVGKVEPRDVSDNAEAGCTDREPASVKRCGCARLVTRHGVFVSPVRVEVERDSQFSAGR
jgi:hypothetical protein